MKKKIKTHMEYNYNLFSGFAIAIQVAAILKFLDITRVLVLENKIFWFDLIILGFLSITYYLQEKINKTLFVGEKVKLDLSKDQKIKICIILLIFIIILILLVFLLRPFFQLFTLL